MTLDTRTLWSLIMKQQKHTYYLSVRRMKKFVFFELVFGGERSGALGTAERTPRTDQTGRRWDWIRYRNSTVFDGGKIRMNRFHVLFECLERLVTFLALGTFYEVFRNFFSFCFNTVRQGWDCKTKPQLTRLQENNHKAHSFLPPCGHFYICQYIIPNS